MKTKSAEIEEEENNNTIISDEEEMQGAVFAKRSGCFWMPCFNGRSSSSEPTDTAARSESRERLSSAPAMINDKAAKQRWWSKGWKKIRDWSEIVAGPKWKTFIRRFNDKKRNNFVHAKFHYDPLSYSLNFDDDPGRSRKFDDDFVRRDFSARYASVPASAKSSMDFGKDCTSFS